MIKLNSIIKIGDNFYKNVESISVSKNARQLVDVAQIKLSFNNRLQININDNFKVKSPVTIYAGYQALPNSVKFFEKWTKTYFDEKVAQNVINYYNGRQIVTKTGKDGVSEVVGGCRKIFEGVISESSFDENTVTIVCRDKLWLLNDIEIPKKVYDEKREKKDKKDKKDKKGKIISNYNLFDEFIKPYVKKAVIDKLVKKFLNYSSYTIGEGATVFSMLQQIYNLTSAHIFTKDDTLYINGAYRNFKEEGVIKISGDGRDSLDGRVKYAPYEHFTIDETADIKRKIKLIVENGSKKKTFGEGGNVITLNLGSNAKLEEDIGKYADQIIGLNQQKDNKSNLVLWLYPYVEPGDYVRVKKFYIKRDDNYTAEKAYDEYTEYDYYVVGVQTDYSANGGRQSLTLENKLNVKQK